MEIENVSNWKAILPTGRIELVQIRVLNPTDALVINPGGSIQISQQLAPLRTLLERYGNQGVDGPNWFEIKEISVGDVPQK
ncbi:MAG: hypothetical protein IPP79_20715 [Chitinophagaceae bacterium]|nr:hypothetical protein [Chitinophagaceae bacterium]